MRLTIVFALMLPCSLSADYTSQAGQDRFVNEYYFHNRKGGIFLDIGAHDGVSFSNTYFFEKELGWTGFCFEPLPHLFKALNECRNCVCINACVSNIDGELPFLHVDSCDEMLSGLCATFDNRKLGAVMADIAHFGGQCKVMPVACVRLNTILQKYGISHIDFFSLDVEGHELEVLKTIDFSKITIDVITVENDYENEELRQILYANGYELVTHLHVDDIFVRNGFVPYTS